MRKTAVNWFWRFIIYLLGLPMIAVGITLSTKAGLGLTTIASFPYAISQALHVNYAVTTFLVYIVTIILQFIIKGRDRQWRDLFQLPVNLVFSSFLAWFGTLIPIHFEVFWQNLLLSVVSVVMIAVGAAMMVNMRLAPNPPDGLAHAMSIAMKKDLGTAKNLLDFIFVALAALIDLLFHKRLVSVGIGTVIAMVLMGRVIYVFNRLFKERILRMAGLV